VQKAPATTSVDPATLKSELQALVHLRRSLLLTISQKPAYLANGERDARVRRISTKPHFSKGFAAGAGFLRDPTASLIFCFICGEENSQFGSKKPLKYLEEFQRKRYFARVMRSHLIPIDQKSGLWDTSVTRGYRSFLKARTRLLCRTFERAAGMKLFRSE
jgi:hypothetical protein